MKDGLHNNMRKRKKFILAAIILLIIEVLIAKYVHDEIVRPYIGDVLVVFVVYAIIRIIIPEKGKLLSLYVFLFAFCIEILQWFHIVEVLHLSDNRFLSVLIGGVFDWKDIICYGIGCLMLGVTEAIVRVKRA